MNAIEACDPAIAELVAQVTGPDGPEARFDVEGRRIEFEALITLLMDGATTGQDAEALLPVARAVAGGCLGSRHLWRDMGLSSRSDLRALLECCFGPLAAGNYRDMRWKKYLYRRLCRWEGFHACPAPSCDLCSSFEECFSPEE